MSANLIEAARAALLWYAEQAQLCRLIHSEGDAGRNALAADGGQRARTALAAAEAQPAHSPRDDYEAGDSFAGMSDEAQPSDPTMTRDELVAAAESIGIRFPLAQPAAPAPIQAIGKVLEEVMERAVKNGANSISMPDHYIEIAMWLATVPCIGDPS